MPCPKIAWSSSSADEDAADDGDDQHRADQDQRVDEGLEEGRVGEEVAVVRPAGEAAVDGVEQVVAQERVPERQRQRHDHPDEQHDAPRAPASRVPDCVVFAVAIVCPPSRGCGVPLPDCLPRSTKCFRYPRGRVALELPETVGPAPGPSPGIGRRLLDVARLGHRARGDVLGLLQRIVDARSARPAPPRTSGRPCRRYPGTRGSRRTGRRYRAPA